MSNGHHWSKFWWKDWDADEGLKMCCFAAQGLWMRLLCIMHKANPIGHLLVNGRSPNTRQIVSLCGGDAKEVAQLLAELEENGVFSRNDGGVIFSRRMVRDADASAAGREFISRRWNPNSPPNSPPSGNGSSQPTDEPKSGPKSSPTNGAKHEPITKKLEASTELESKKEREGKDLPSNIIPMSRAREEPSTAQRLGATTQIGRVTRALATTVGHAQGKKPQLDRWDQAKLLGSGPGPKHLTPEQLALARRRTN